MRRFIGALVALFAGVIFAGGNVSAHTPQVSDRCSGLSLSLTNYESAPGPTLNNRVTVTIDGASQVFDFDGSYVNAFSWSPTSNHAWTVVIDANRYNGSSTQWDRTFEGSEMACQTTTTEPEETTTTTTEPEVTTTTIVDETTTTVTVTVPDETTTTLASVETTTTLAPVVSVGTAPVPSTPVDPARGPLPKTGARDSGSLIVVALVLVGIGAVMVRLSSSRVTRS